MYMNDYDVSRAADVAERVGNDNTLSGILTLVRLMRWSNEVSDGWAYWVKPSNAAKRLMVAIDAQTKAYFADRGDQDWTDAELRALKTPIKAFLTRQGVDAGTKSWILDAG